MDEHNHPVDPRQVDLRDKRYQPHRGYQLVSLIHVNRKLDFCLVVAARVVSGRGPEGPILYDLVAAVVGTLHHGFIQVLMVDCGLIDGERIGRRQQELAIDSIVPLPTNMDLYADAIGLTRRRGLVWEPDVPQAAPPVECAPPRPARVAKREAQRRRTLAERTAKAASTRSAAALARLPRGPPQTWLELGCGLWSWSQGRVPLTAVGNRQPDQHGQTQDGVLVSTAERLPAAQIRSTCQLRPAVPERPRQYQGFRDLTRMHAGAFSRVVHPALLVWLAYTVVQADLVLRQPQQLHRGLWERTGPRLSPTCQVVAV